MPALALGTLCTLSLHLAVLTVSAWLASRWLRPTADGRQLLWRLVIVLAFASPAMAWLVPAAPAITRPVGTGAVFSAIILRVHSQGGMAVAPILWGVLSCGAFVRIAWLVASAVSLRRLRGASAVSLPLFDCLRETLAVDARLVSAATRQPFTFGLRSPIVVVPDDFLDRPADVQRGVLVHELVHVRRGDWLTACARAGGHGVLLVPPGNVAHRG